MKRYLGLFILCVAVLTAVRAAHAEVPVSEFSVVIDKSYFRLNRDATKTEMPEDGGCRVLPRRAGVTVWTRASVPNDRRSLQVWNAAAVVRSLNGAAGGVSIHGIDRSAVLMLYPEGRGVMRITEGKQSLYRREFELKNLSYPARLEIVRDMNGSFTASVNGAVVACFMEEVDYNEPKTWDVTSAGFATFKETESENASVLYDRIEISAYGRRPELKDKKKSIYDLLKQESR